MVPVSPPLLIWDPKPTEVYSKPVITELGYKLKSQIRAVFSFYYLKRLARMKSLLFRQHWQTVMHTFMDYSNSLCVTVNQSLFLRLQLVQNAAA